MQSSVLSSEESENIRGEFEHTNHHENILTGIQTLQKIYETSNSQARHHVEEAYVEYFKKLPKLVKMHRSRLKEIKNVKTVENFSPETRISFHLLKCNLRNGGGRIKIFTLDSDFCLDSKNDSFIYSGNFLEMLTIECLTFTDDIFTFSIPILEKLSHFPHGQIVFCNEFLVFVNEKNSNVDFSLCLKLELSEKDKFAIIRLKNRETQKMIKKLKVDSQGIDIQREFKQSCCECLVI
jgi:hypothetical protein